MWCTVIYYGRGNVDNKKPKGYPYTVNIYKYHTLCHSSLHLCLGAVSSILLSVVERCDRVPGIRFFLPLNLRGWVSVPGICCFTSVEALQSHSIERLLLLAGTLFFFLPHPLPQLLTDISQRVHFGREGLYCVAKPAGLCFPTIKAKHTNVHIFKGKCNFTAKAI